MCPEGGWGPFGFSDDVCTYRELRICPSLVSNFFLQRGKGARLTRYYIKGQSAEIKSGVYRHYNREGVESDWY